MSVQTAARPQPETTSPRSRIQRLAHSWRTLVVVLAMLAAAAAGVVAAAQLTSPATTPTQTVYQEPNANTREDRASAAASAEPNANTREGRVTAPTPTNVEPNANTREGRVSANG